MPSKVKVLFDTRGAAAVEFAVIAPVMLAMLLPLADLGVAAVRYVGAYEQLRSVGAYAAAHPPADITDLSGYLSGVKPASISVAACGDTLPCSGTVPTSPPISLLLSTTITLKPM